MTEQQRLRGSRVLVIDDDGEQAHALALLLREEEGILATSAADPRVALKQVEASPVDALVLDVNMPGLTGTDLLTALRKSYPGLPVVLLTGYERGDARIAKAMASGAIAYLAKPTNVGSVAEALVRLLAR